MEAASILSEINVTKSKIDVLEKQLEVEGTSSEREVAIRNQIVENTKLITALLSHLPAPQNTTAGKGYVSSISLVFSLLANHVNHIIFIRVVSCTCVYEMDSAIRKDNRARRQGILWRAMRWLLFRCR
jgi:hypothetical protein